MNPWGFVEKTFNMLSFYGPDMDELFKTDIVQESKELRAKFDFLIDEVVRRMLRDSSNQFSLQTLVETKNYGRNGSISNRGCTGTRKPENPTRRCSTRTRPDLNFSTSGKTRPDPNPNLKPAGTRKRDNPEFLPQNTSNIQEFMRFFSHKCQKKLKPDPTRNPWTK